MCGIGKKLAWQNQEMDIQWMQYLSNILSNRCSFFQVSDGRLKVTFIVSNGFDFAKIGFNCTGTITIGKEDISLNIEKAKGTAEARITMDAQSINVTEFLMTFASRNLDYSSSAKMDRYLDVKLISPEIR